MKGCKEKRIEHLSLWHILNSFLWFYHAASYEQVFQNLKVENSVLEKNYRSDIWDCIIFLVILAIKWLVNCRIERLQYFTVVFIKLYIYYIETWIILAYVRCFSCFTIYFFSFGHFFVLLNCFWQNHLKMLTLSRLGGGVPSPPLCFILNDLKLER